LNWLAVLNRMKLSSGIRILLSLSVLYFREHISFDRKFFLVKPDRSVFVLFDSIKYSRLSPITIALSAAYEK